MKSLFFYFVVFVLVASCTIEPKNYISISGKIENHDPKRDTITFGAYYEKYRKVIKIKPDGSFKDTLMYKKAKRFIMYYGSEGANLFLKPGYDLNITSDANQFRENLKFSGVGKESSYFAANEWLLRSAINFDLNPDLNEADFNKQLDSMLIRKQNFIKENAQGVDSILIAEAKEKLPKFKPEELEKYKKYREDIAKLTILDGKSSPVFTNYENAKGGTTSLSDLKGKYVYIDIWATWCGPCKAEIPSLKKIEKEFHDKNITFVSISTDDGKGFKGDPVAANVGWKKMVIDEDLGGIQLIADKGFKSDFITKYTIQFIPRFILIGPDGKVVKAYAPKPSDPELKKLLLGLKNI